MVIHWAFVMLCTLLLLLYITTVFHLILIALISYLKIKIKTKDLSVCPYEWIKFKLISNIQLDNVLNRNQEGIDEIWPKIRIYNTNKEKCALLHFLQNKCVRPQIKLLFFYYWRGLMMYNENLQHIWRKKKKSGKLYLKFNSYKINWYDSKRTARTWPTIC